MFVCFVVDPHENKFLSRPQQEKMALFKDFFML